MTPRGPVAIAALALAGGLFALAPLAHAAGPTAKPWQPPASATPEGSYLPDTTVMARFEGSPIRAGLVVARYFDALPTERPEADSSGRALFLHTMVDQLVLGRVAHQVNRPFGFEDRATMRDYEQRVLSNQLFKRFVLDSVVVDTSKMRAAYEQMGTDHRLRWILFADRATADRVRSALVRGTMSWPQAYARYHRGIQRPDAGDLGWIDRLSSGDRFPASVYRLKAGQVSELWPDVGGWNMVQCVETRQITRPIYRVVSTRLEGMVRQSSVSALSDRLLARLRERVHVAYDTANVVWVAERFAIADLEAGPRTTVRLTHRVPTFAPEDTGRVLARSDVGNLSINGFLHAYSEMPAVSRPMVDTPERLRRQIDATMLEPQRAEMARALGFEKDREVIEQLDKRREAIMVEHLYADSVESRIQVTSEMRRKYYDENLPKFVTYPRVRFAVIIADRKGESDSLAARLRAGEKPEDILRADSLAHRPKRGSVRWMSQKDEGAPLYALLFNEMKPGQVEASGPDEDGVYPVIQSLEYDSGHQLSFEESSSMADAAVQNLEAERLLNEFVDRHRRQFRIEEHPELVMRVLWRDPTLPRPTHPAR